MLRLIHIPILTDLATLLTLIMITYLKLEIDRLVVAGNSRYVLDGPTYSILYLVVKTPWVIYRPNHNDKMY
jgi:hypothetical protein